MTNLFLEGNLIVNLNELSQIPLPLAKYALTQWMLYLQHQPNHYQHSTILKYFRHEGVEIDHRTVTAVVQYLFKSAKKMGMTAKQLNTLLNENTMLSGEHSALLLELYTSFLSNDGSGEININSFHDMKWSAVSLRQTQDRQQPNKLYMKVEFSTDNSYGEVSKAVNMSLLQFKLFLEQANKVQSLVNV